MMAREGGFQVSDIFNIYSKASSFMDIRRKFSFQVSGIFNIYSIYIQLSSYKDIGYIFPTNSVHIQYISSVQFLTVPTGIRAVTSTWRTMTNELRRRRGVPTSRMES